MGDNEKELKEKVEFYADLINKSISKFNDEANKISQIFTNATPNFQHIALGIKNYVSFLENEALILKENSAGFSNALTAVIDHKDSNKKLKVTTLAYLKFTQGTITTFENTRNGGIEVEKAFQRFPDKNDKDLKEAKQKSSATMPNVHKTFAEIIAILQGVVNHSDKSLNNPDALIS